MDLEDSGVDCIYDCVWVRVCVSPVMSCVQACSQGQAEWVMNIQWQDQWWLSEIQALGPYRRFEGWIEGGAGGQMDLEAWNGPSLAMGCIIIWEEENEPMGAWKGYVLDLQQENFGNYNM